METKQNMMRGSEDDALAEKAYNAWLTNIALSYHVDTVMIANQMNSNFHLNNKAQYEYLLNAVRKKKRPYIKWNLKTNDEDLDLVCSVYNISKTKGLEYLKILSETDLKSLKTSKETGGLQSDK
jgi:predicted nucleotidyltransferase